MQIKRIFSTLMIWLFVLGVAACSPMTEMPLPKTAQWIEPTQVAQFVAPTSSPIPTATRTPTARRVPTRTPTNTATAIRIPTMRFTPSQSVQKISPPRISEWVSDILAVDYIAQTVQVNIKGASGPRFLKVPVGTNLGTASNKIIYPGFKAVVRQNDDFFYIANIFQEAAKAATATSVLSPLAAPTGFSIVQRGSQLHAQWNPVQGANAYELWSSDVAGPSGSALTMVARTSGTTYDTTLNAGANSNLITVNPGFESGNLTGWDAAFPDPGWGISSVDKNTGIYSALGSPKSGTADLYGIYYNVVGGQSYNISFWHRITANPNSGTLKVFLDQFIPPNTTSIVTLFNLSASDAVWTQSSTAITVNAAATQVRLRPSAYMGTGSGGLVAYIDDFSIIGPPVSVTSLFYAVRALDINTGRASAFTSWLKIESPQTSALGIPSAIHEVADYTNAQRLSSNYVANSTGWNLSAASGYDGIAKTISGSTLTLSQFLNLANGVAASPSFRFTNDDDTGIINGGSANTLAFITGGVECARISASGNVGIGTTLPRAKLDVNAGGTTDMLFGFPAIAPTYNLVSLNGSNAEGIYVGISGGGGTDTDLYVQSGNAGNIHFRTGNGSAFSEKVTLLNGGNFGIGTTAPVAKLDIAGPLALAMVTKTTAYTVSASDSTVLGDTTAAGFTITLPTVVGIKGRHCTVVKTSSDGNTLTLAAAAGETIQGTATKATATQWSGWRLQADGTATWVGV